MRVTLKTIGKFFIDITPEHISGELRMLYDGCFVWLANARTCFSCFQERYAVWRLGMQQTGYCFPLPEHGVSLQSLDFLKTIVECASLPRGTVRAYDLKGEELLLVAQILPSELCQHCMAQENNHQIEQVSQSISLSADSLLNYVQHLFGVIAHSQIFEQGGLVDAGNADYLAVILTAFPAQESYMPYLCSARGADRELTQIRVLMEFFERYAFVHQVFLTRVVIAKLAEEGRKAYNFWVRDVSPKDALLYSLAGAAQVQISVLNLHTGSPALLPLAMVYQHPLVRKRLGLGALPSKLAPTTNGFAAHWNQTSAIEHATLELFERDACMRWWRNPATAKRMVVAGELRAAADALVALVSKTIDVEVYIDFLLVPSRCAVPVVVAFLASRAEQGGPRILIGSAAAFDWQEAARKALDELSLNIYNYISWHAHGEQEPLAREAVVSAQDHGVFYYTKHQANLVPWLNDVELFDVLNIVPGGPSNSDELANSMRTFGYSWYMLDATPAMIRHQGVVVVKCIIPELEQISFGAQETGLLHPFI